MYLPLLLAVCSSASLASLSPQFLSENRHPIDRFLLVKPYTRWISKFHALGSILTTISEIRLTRDVKSMRGAIWSKEALGMDSFTVDTRLRISARSPLLAADGMGIWFTEKTSLGSAYGIGPIFKGFGIVLDVYDNTNSRRTPLLGLVASNGSNALDNYDNGAKHMLESCRIYDSGAMIRDVVDHNAPASIAIHIEYLPGKMGIYYKLDRDLVWQHCLTYNNIFIPNYYFLGVSASTGDLTAQQDLLALRVYDLPVDGKVKARGAMHFDQANLSARTTTSDGSPIFSVFFFAFAFFAVIGCMIIIIKPELIPGTQASIDRKKRFY